MREESRKARLQLRQLQLSWKKQVRLPARPLPDDKRVALVEVLCLLLKDRIQLFNHD